MKLFKNKLNKKILSVGLALLFIVSQNMWHIHAEVPNDYVANNQVIDEWDNIVGLFVEIEALNKIGQNIPEEKFTELNELFSIVFPHFPNDYGFKVVYEQCLLTTSNLGQEFTYHNFSAFMNTCYKPFQSILRKIESQYTIIAKASASPSKWSAPLTVTFDARNSEDPSNDTIPADNFFWYYKDIDGVNKTIGIGPIINHTFEKAGNYLIHLTVRSANQEDKWIFDGEDTVAVEVAPKSAIITVYANGQKMSSDKPIKIWMQEAQRWIIFDASATIPIGGRQLISYVFDIQGKEWFSYTENGEGSPTVLNVILPDKWEFTTRLQTIDNEWNKLTEKFRLVVSDPVALIKQTPEDWTTSTTFSFDASTSYSVISRIRLFTREIFNQEGEKLDTYQGKKIQQKFTKPWSYTVKLTAEDDLWKKRCEYK